MFPKGANMSKILKQAQKIKKDMEEAENSLEDMRVSCKSNDGMVEITMSGKKNLISF